MRKCVLDGARLRDPAAVYRTLEEAFRLPEGSAADPEALRSALGAYRGEPVEIVWRHAAHSSHVLRPHFAEIVSALQHAAAQGMLTLELA
jgi:RNAse (barnase) inhibitor barstar